jgi:hypothetical protein
MSRHPRVLNVVAAVVHNAAHQFFVAYSPRWSQYAVPMRKPKPGESLSEVARRAVEDHCPHPLGEVTAAPLECVSRFGWSRGAGENTFYNYHVFEVVPQHHLPAGQLASWCGFLAYDALLDSSLVTASTKDIARALMENQQVSVAVVCRPGASGTEFLLVQKVRYQGFFFPATRRKTDDDPGELALAAVQADTGYLGRVRLLDTLTPDVDVEQYSPRYQRQRHFRFHLRRIEFPELDLQQPGNPLEAGMASEGVTWRWLTAEQLADTTGFQLSPTVDLLRQHVGNL